MCMQHSFKLQQKRNIVRSVVHLLASFTSFVSFLLLLTFFVILFQSIFIRLRPLLLLFQQHRKLCVLAGIAMHLHCSLVRCRCSLRCSPHKTFLSESHFILLFNVFKEYNFLFCAMFLGMGFV